MLSMGYLLCFLILWNQIHFLFLIVSEQRICFKHAGYGTAPSLSENATSRSTQQLNIWEIWETLRSQEMQSYIDCKTPCQIK